MAEELRLLALEAPESIAVVGPERDAITFGEFRGRIHVVASALTGHRVARGDTVAVVMPDGPELLSTILGVSAAATCAPLNPALRSREMESHLKDLGAGFLLVDRAVDSQWKTVAHRLGIPVLDTNERTDSHDSRVISHVIRGSDVALILQTSSTTGESRRVPITHSNLRAMADSTRNILDLTAADTFLSMMPLFHLTGLLSSLAQLLAGGRVISTAGFDASLFLGWMERFHPTWYTATPAVHHAVLPLLRARPDVVGRSPLRFARSIGAPLPQTLHADLEDVLRAPVLEGYGMTEAGMVTSNAPPPGRRRAGSVGQRAGVKVAILSDSGRALRDGAEGEIAVRGSAVIQGYRNDAAADQSAFRDGWFLTGDVGYFDEEGFLFVTGRIKDIINRGGEKVLPREIDEALLRHPLVSEAVAFGIKHPSLGEDVAAAVVLVSGASATEAELRRFAADGLAAFKVPRRIFVLPEIPKGATGKVRRAAIAQQVAALPGFEADPNVASTPVERALEKLWKRILRVEQVSIDDDFFSLGGDSLGLTLLIAEIESEFGAVEGLDGPEFFSSPSIKTLAGLLASRPSLPMKGIRSPVVPLQPMGSRIPFFCLPGADENPYYFRDLARNLGRAQPFYVLRDSRPFEERGVYSVEEHAPYFIRAIRSVRPHGPYILGGHCYGGILAFETARQLVQSGEEVSLLALFEVPTPGYPKIARHTRKYLSQAKRISRGEAHLTWSEARSHVLRLTGLLKRKTQALGRRRLVSAGLKSLVAPVEEVGRCNVQAGRAYTPKRFDGKVVHFIAADEPHSTLILDDPRLGWNELVDGGISVKRVAGRAETIFRPPSIDDLAGQFRELLDQINSPGRNHRSAME